MIRLARGLGAVGIVLPGIDFFDELASGLPVAGAPEIRTAFGIGVAALTLAVFTAPLLVSLVVEVPLLLWAERRNRAAMIALGLAGMGLSLILAGCAGSALWFGVAFALYAPASGLACGLAQAALMDSDPEQRERRMTSWALCGALGDLFAPLAIGAAVFASSSFRSAWLGVGVLLVTLAFGVRRLELENPAAADSEEEPAAVGAAPDRKQLMLWLGGVALCGLMDETLSALAALWVRERFPAHPEAVGAVLMAGTAGAALGLLWLDRLLLLRSPRLLLALSCAGSALLHIVWLVSESILGAICSMFFACAVTAAHYPIAQAQAYRAGGRRSGLVAALAAVFSVFELGAPLVVGVIADGAGLRAALASVLLQPLGLLVVLWLTRRYR